MLGFWGPNHSIPAEQLPQPFLFLPFPLTFMDCVEKRVVLLLLPPLMRLFLLPRPSLGEELTETNAAGLEQGYQGGSESDQTEDSTHPLGRDQTEDQKKGSRDEPDMGGAPHRAELAPLP